ncbi:MAG TPA: hypothetical protein VLT36_17430 [Candidatus Dormibacteraeota bacterium]|nr:hypothetical protein [Candidatus Dormibacteraeota bacterium]
MPSRGATWGTAWAGVGPGRAAASRAFDATMQMNKLDIATVQPMRRVAGTAQ